MKKIFVSLLVIWIAIGIPVEVYGASQAAPTADVNQLVAKTQAQLPPGGLNLITSMRQVALLLLLTISMVAAAFAMAGNMKMSISVLAGGVVLYGGIWIVLLIVESLGSPTSSQIPQLTGYGTFQATTGSAANGPTGPVVALLNGGLDMLTTVTLPFCMIYNIFLGLAVNMQEADHSSKRSAWLGAIVAIGASILLQTFKFF
jgi:hypothetical protein